MADKEFRIKHVKSCDYKIIAATDAYGGVSPSREIVFDFIIERPAYPDQIILTTGDNQSRKEEYIKSKECDFIRESQIGVVLRPDIAFQIGQWLIDKAKEAGLQEIKPEEAKK